MALFKCKSCGAQVSDNAKACPQCGEPTPKPTSRLTIAVAGLLAIGVAHSIFSRSEQGAQTPAAVNLATEDRAALERAAADRQRGNQRRAQGVATGQSAVDSIKRQMREPASFELASAILLDDGALCITYRGRNGFGGMNIERAVAVGATVLLGDEGYRTRCTSKAGQEIAREL